MTISMRVMSAGDGYKYLLKTIAAADGDRSPSTPLTRYYVEAGTPPGRWLGAGIGGLGKGELSVGDRVSEAQLQLLIGMGRDPITGNPLGLAFPNYKTSPERIESRIAALDPALTPGAKGEAVAQITAEETARGTRRAVAGFDFTFSIPKSASVLWAVADAGAQVLIGEAHHRAVAGVVAFMEREVAATRTGATAGTARLRRSMSLGSSPPHSIISTPVPVTPISTRMWSLVTRPRPPSMASDAHSTEGQCTPPSSPSPSCTKPCSRTT